MLMWPSVYTFFFETDPSLIAGDEEESKKESRLRIVQTQKYIYAKGVNTVREMKNCAISWKVVYFHICY